MKNFLNIYLKLGCSIFIMQSFLMIGAMERASTSKKSLSFLVFSIKTSNPSLNPILQVKTSKEADDYLECFNDKGDSKELKDLLSVWQKSLWQNVYTIPANENKIIACSSSHLAFAREKELTVVSLKDLTSPIKIIFDSSINHIAFNEEGTQLLVAEFFDPDLKIVDVTSGEKNNSRVLCSLESNTRILASKSETGQYYTAEGNLEDAFIKIFDLKGNCVQREPLSKHIHKLSFVPHSSHVILQASLESNPDLEVYDWNSKEKVAQCSTPLYLMDFAAHPSTGFIYMIGLNGKIEVFSYGDGIYLEGNFDQGGTTKISFSPAGSKLLLGYLNKIEVYNNLKIDGSVNLQQQLALYYYMQGIRSKKIKKYLPEPFGSK